jgi:TRAP-type C4-dicarboxylate transport system permease small subunit
VQTDRPPIARTKGILLWLTTRVCHIGFALAAASLLIVVAINAANIIGRYMFRSPFSWAEEAMLYIMIFGVFTAAVSLAWQRAHIHIDAFLNYVPPKYRRMLEFFSALVVVVILVPVVVASHRVTSLLFGFDQRSDALNLPMWIPQGILPLSLSLIALMTVLRLFVRPPNEHDATGPDVSRE